MLKGVSPLIAIILLIAIAVAVSGILSVWILPSAKEQTEFLGREFEKEIYCSKARIRLFGLEYCSTTNKMSGKIENYGDVPLGEIKLLIYLENGTGLLNPLCRAGGEIISCATSNLTIEPAEIVSFNLSSSSNYDFVKVTTNCSNAYYSVSSRFISQVCS